MAVFPAFIATLALAATPVALGQATQDRGPRASEQMISPEATMQVDEEELLARLLAENPSSGNPMQVLDGVVSRMSDAAKRLSRRDAGDVTRETQRRIVADLDLLIDMVKRSENASSGAGTAGGRPEPGSAAGNRPKPGGSTGGGAAPANDSTSGGASAAAAAEAGNIHDIRRDDWHRLPARDRNAIANRPREEVPGEYRALVERFYAGLATKAAK